MKALLVDDSRAMRSIIRRTLAEIGFEVLEAINGIDALRQLGETHEKTDLAIIDWNMPEMDGLELLKALRNKPEFADMCMIMVTSETEVDRVAAALEAGADEYVMKPFTKEDLIEKLRQLGLIEG